MNKLDIDSIYKQIGNFGGISVKHRVSLFQADSNGKNKEYKRFYGSSKSKGGMAGYMSYYFRKTTNALILESNDFDSKETQKIKNSVYLTQDDLSEVERILNESEFWFKDPELKNNLFVYENNNPYKVSDKYYELCSIMYLTYGLRGSFLSIQPAVVNDFKTRIGYPGVVIKSITGVVGCCTVKEFLSMSMIIRQNLRNLHSISLELLNHYMLTELLKI